MRRQAEPSATARWARAAMECIRLVVLAAAIAVLFPAVASAHEVRPAYLSVQEEAPNEFSVLFKTPMQGDARLALSALFSGKIETLTPIVSHPTGDAMVQTWRMRTLEPLAGRNVLIDGLQNTMTDALVHVVFANGNSWTARLTPSEPSAVIPASQSAWAVFLTYVRHGIEHIAFGFDHLLFVTALMLIVRDWRKLVKAITAFTAAHSITLTCATLGWVTLPSAPVEAMIAISIVLVAAEVVRMERGQLSLAIVQAVDGRLRLRPAARLRLCRRAGRARLAAERHPVGAASLQRRRRARAAGFHRRVAKCDLRRAAGPRHSPSGDRHLGLRNRHSRGILERPAAGRDGPTILNLEEEVR